MLRATAAVNARDIADTVAEQTVRAPLTVGEWAYLITFHRDAIDLMFLLESILTRLPDYPGLCDEIEASGALSSGTVSRIAIDDLYRREVYALAAVRRFMDGIRKLGAAIYDKFLRYLTGINDPGTSLRLLMSADGQRDFALDDTIHGNPRIGLGEPRAG